MDELTDALGDVGKVYQTPILIIYNNDGEKDISWGYEARLKLKNLYQLEDGI